MVNPDATAEVPTANAARRLSFRAQGSKGECGWCPLLGV